MIELRRCVLDTFTVRLPRWPVLLRLSGRDPLVRRTDRIEALVLVLAVVVALVAAPIAAAVGTEVYDSRGNFYAEQAHNRHSVTATVTDVPASQQDLLTTDDHRGGPMDCRRRRAHRRGRGAIHHQDWRLH